MRWEWLALTAAAFAFLGLRHWRQRSNAQAARSAVYDDCLALIEAPRAEPSGTTFPTLHGRYRGHAIRLDAIVDSAALRKLPSVWLQLNVIEPLPVAATLDVLVRPLNTEFFSPAAQLLRRIDVPAGWPEHALIKADGEAAEQLLGRVDSAVRELFADERCKELLVTPKGLRVVYQLAQADRADYLVLRAMVFDAVRVPATLFSHYMDRLIALHQALR